VDTPQRRSAQKLPQVQVSLLEQAEASEKMPYTIVFYLGKFLLGAVVCTLSPLLFAGLVVVYLVKVVRPDGPAKKRLKI